MAESNPAYVFFERALNKRRLSNRIAAVVVTLLSIVAVVWGLSEPGDRAMARMAAVGAFGLLFGPVVLGLSFRASKGLEAIGSPRRIVWFYGVGQARHVTGVMIGTGEGKLHKLPVPSLDEGPQALVLLRQVTTEATEGFSEERRLKFRAQPESLRTTTRAAS
ncbi:MAG: hypothetical protein H6721_10975 [Sandaracinus sp.]|nr:hypothetical protein [Sandaracinus sp.]MCB9618712.1 hypothetical protein [Sandaracinus sp.]MCB9632643.1 hypothetical protein [Sandaracinus sp.]